jgi:hypothetical protein
MRPSEKIKELFTKSKVKVGSELDNKILIDIFTVFEKSKINTSADLQPSVWRIIMKNRITKLAVAAVVIVAVLLSVHIFDKTVPTAFGIEQIIEAYNNIRFLHVKQFGPNQHEPAEFWIKSDEQGRVAKARYYLPETEDGAKLITWSPERTELWFKYKHGFSILQSKRAKDWMQELLEQCQPKLVMQKLLDDQKAGKVGVDIEKPNDKQKPAHIIAKYKFGSKKTKEIYYIDQATDLITQVDIYGMKDNQEVLKVTREFYDYNVPIDEKMFAIRDEIPRYVYASAGDILNQLCGVPQGNMSDEQVAAETVRQFFQALIDKDYKKAGLICVGGFEESTKRDFGDVNVIAIVSIGPAIPEPNWVEHGFRVPCELEVINLDGQKTTWEPSPYVRPGDDEMHSDRWNISGGIDVIEVQLTQIKVLPDNEKYARMNPKEAATAFLEALGREDWNEVMKFWPASTISDDAKQYFGGLEIISIGEPFKEKDYTGWYVPYEIKLKSGEVEKWRLGIRNDNKANRYIFDRDATESS